MVAVSSTMTSSTATEGEPILSRLDRIDIMLRQLEEIKGCNINSHNNNPVHQSSQSAKSSCESTPSSGSTLTSDYYASTADNLSPKSLEKHCRPIQNVMMETGAKGTLIERLDHVEERVLKMCMQLEEELMEAAAERKRRHGDDILVKNLDEDDEARRTVSSSPPLQKMMKKKKGLKELVKQCVTGKTN